MRPGARLLATIALTVPISACPMEAPPVVLALRDAPRRAPVVVHAPSLPVSPARAAVLSPRAAEREAVEAMNAERRARNLPALRVDAAVSDVARAHSRRMAAQGRIFHVEDLEASLERFRWRIAGENVGVGSPIAAIHDAFMASRKHRENVLYAAFDSVGVGVAWQGGKAYITVRFLGG